MCNVFQVSGVENPEWRIELLMQQMMRDSNHFIRICIHSDESNAGRMIRYLLRKKHILCLLLLENGRVTANGDMFEALYDTSRKGIRKEIRQYCFYVRIDNTTTRKNRTLRFLHEILLCVRTPVIVSEKLYGRYRLIA